MQVKVALAGNPGCGKTTLFNVLTSGPQTAGSRSGITVEKKEGKVQGEEDITLLDLPGLYSLSPYTLEEAAARRGLVNEKPDVILNLIDGMNLMRSLFLSTQLFELGIPVVIAVGKMDLVRKQGFRVDCRKLGERLNCRCLELSARENEGCLAAVRAAAEAARAGKDPEQGRPAAAAVFSDDVERALRGIGEILKGRVPEHMLRWYGIKVFERDGRVLEILNLSAQETEQAESLIRAVECAEDDDSESVLTNQRYVFISSVMEDL